MAHDLHEDRTMSISPEDLRRGMNNLATDFDKQRPATRLSAGSKRVQDLEMSAFCQVYLRLNHTEHESE